MPAAKYYKLYKEQKEKRPKALPHCDCGEHEDPFHSTGTMKPTQLNVKNRCVKCNFEPFYLLTVNY